VPYYFALGNLSLSIDALVNPGLVNVTTSIEQTNKYASNGMIDPTRNMFMDRVFVYHGANDTRVFTGQSSVTFVHPTQAIEIFGNVLRHVVPWPCVTFG